MRQTRSRSEIRDQNRRPFARLALVPLKVAHNSPSRVSQHHETFFPPNSALFSFSFNLHSRYLLKFFCPRAFGVSFANFLVVGEQLREMRKIAQDELTFANYDHHSNKNPLANLTWSTLKANQQQRKKAHRKIPTRLPLIQF